MPTYTKVVLSESTDGRPIKITTTGTPGTLIHTAHATALDEIWIYLTNTSVSDVVATLQWGGTTDPDDLVKQTIEARAGLDWIVSGQLLTNSLEARIFAGTANVINAMGWVNRIT